MRQNRRCDFVVSHTLLWPLQLLFVRLVSC